MPTNTNLGGVFMKDTDGNLNTGTYLSSENVCGIIFDTKVVGGLAAALGNGDAATNFANGNVVELNTMDDIAAAGITDSIMCGLPLFHLTQFFQLAGDNQRLFVSFMDSTSDTTFSAIEQMQLAAKGLIYQIGVWTGEAIATAGEGNADYTVVSNGVLSKLQAQAEVLGGRIGQTNFEGNAPVNIVVTAPIVNAATCDYNKLPDLTSLNLPKVTMLVGQAAGAEVHAIQLALATAVQESTSYALVGCVGAILACLAVAPADESIAHVENFNMSQAMTSAELGFGNLTVTSGAYASSASFTNIDTIGYTKRNTRLHQKGYVFLTTLDGIENGIFASSDQTLSTGDYRLITRCRVMHKSRRVVRRSLLPYVNQTWEVDSSTGSLNEDDITIISNTVYRAIDNNMVQPGTTNPQISGREVIIDPDQDILSSDQLLITYKLVPKGTTAAIYVTEGFTSSIG